MSAENGVKKPNVDSGQKKSWKNRMIGEKIFLSFFFVFLFILVLTLLYPFVWCVINALKSNFEFLEDSFGLPKELLFENFLQAFKDVNINGATVAILYLNSIWMSVLHVIVNIGSSLLAAYAIAKFRIPGKTVIFSMVILIQVLPIIGTGPALYKFLYNAGIANNPALIWLIWSSGFDFAFIVLYGYFKSISDSYSEAAYIDGAGHFRTMVQVMLPQALPAIASLMILNFIGAWNDYTTPLLYMRGYPNLALGIFMFKEISQFATIGTPILLAVILMAVLPLLIIFAVCQKMIMTSVTAGGLKG